MKLRHYSFLIPFIALIVILPAIGGCSGSEYGSPADPSMVQTGQDGTRTGTGARSAPYLIGFNKTPGQSEQALIRAHNGSIKYSFDLIPAIAASLSPQAVEALQKNPNVEYIEPDGRTSAVTETLPWGIPHINADDVWALGYTGLNVNVAILDTGTDYNHPDLSPNYAGGYDFVNTDNDPIDDAGHGTHVTGTAGAVDDDFGVVGVAPDITIYAVKILDANGNGYYSDLIAGINWSVNNGIDVINMSLGGLMRSKSLQNACNAAYDAGLVLVAAAGNSGNPFGTGNNVEYPARYDSVIAVASVNSNNQRAGSSSTGGAVELSAPGVNILSDLLGGGIGTGSGTSMASPHVTGAVALLIESGVTDPSSIRALLQVTAIDLGVPGLDKLYGYGLVDILAAVTGTPPPPPPSQSDGSIGGKVTNSATGKNLPGVTVTVVSTGQFDLTNGGGRYKIDGVESGLQEITASAPGFQAATDFVTVIEGVTVTLNFSLVPD